MYAVLQYFAFLGVILILLLLIFGCICCKLSFFDRRRQQRDRQGNTCPQANGAGRENGFNDIFFIEPNSREAARIRAQLEKDDKDLPSYDEVMRIANLSSPTAAPAMPSALTMGASTSSINTNDTALSLPPYRVDETSVRPLTPPPYTAEPIGDTVVVPIIIPLHSQQNTQST